MKLIVTGVVLLVVLSFLVMVGFIFLIVPGAILALVWCVAFPVMVMERPGVFASLGRSAFLTKGNRWRLFGFFLLLSVGMFVVGVVLTLILPSPETIQWILIVTLINLVFSAFLGVYWFTLPGIIYYDLRMAKDGIDIGRAAAVFD